MLNRTPQAAFVEHPGQWGEWSEIASESAMLRGVMFLALVGGAGFSAWTSFQDSSRKPLDWAVGEMHAMVTRREAPAEEPPVIEARPMALQTEVVFQTEAAIPDDRFTISSETLAAITCGPWDVSDLGIEAILQEMIRRGWTPPSGARALEMSHDNGGIAVAVDPDAPVPAISSPAETPVISAEAQPSAEGIIVDATLAALPVVIEDPAPP